MSSISIYSSICVHRWLAQQRVLLMTTICVGVILIVRIYASFKKTMNFNSITRGIFVIYIALMLTSCASIVVRFAYNNIDWWVVDYADDYFDLTSAQETQLTDLLEQARPWHREVMLPQIALFLQRVKQYSEVEDITLVEVRSLGADMDKIKNQHIEKLLPEVATLLTTITPAQRDHARIYAQEIHDERMEIINSGEYLPQLTDKIQDRFVSLFGTIHAEQEAIINAHIAQADIFRTQQLAEVARTNEWLFDLVARAHQGILTTSELVDTLQPRLKKPEVFFKEPYKTVWHERRTDAYRMVVALHHTLSDEQKRHFASEMDDYIGLVDSLLVEQPLDQSPTPQTDSQTGTAQIIE